jgi:hypothetical protein
VYGTARDGVYTVNRETGQCSPIASAYGDDPVENPHAVVFDSRRKRLMVWGTDLYTYDPATKKWSSQRHSGQALIAATYAHDEDIIYAMERNTDPSGSIPLQVIARINSHGTLIDRIAIGRRTWLGSFWNRAQLALAGDKLILTVPSSRRRSGDKDAAKSSFCIYTLDRKTGEVVWSSESLTVQTKPK